jgi:hypothetical protein
MVALCAFTQGLRRVAIEELGKVEAELKKEAREDAELRERHGAAWNRPSSAALNSTLLEKVAGAFDFLGSTCAYIHFKQQDAGKKM